MNEMLNTHTTRGRKTITALLAIAATLALVSLSASRSDTTSKVYGFDLFMQAQQTQPGNEPLVPVGTSFTYQGRLKDGSNPANGQYDFQFLLYDSLTGGNQIGLGLLRNNQTVNEGLVTSILDFGSTAFQGDARFLEVRVRLAGVGSFTPLSPRQPVSPAPYATSMRPGMVISTSTQLVQLATSLDGVFASSTAAGGYGVRGINHDFVGVQGSSNFGTGVRGESSNGWAGRFQGNVQVTGSLSKGSGSFQIDHPLDPANKYLYHSFVESPDMMNIYNGNATLDTKGEATVQLPEWFGALNKEFRYQLTAVGAPGPNLYIAKKVESNRFSIAGGSPGMEVSWQVTGIRKDAYAEKNRIQVEEDKGEDRGKYLHPEEHGQPESKGIGYEESQRLQREP